MLVLGISTELYNLRRTLESPEDSRNKVLGRSNLREKVFTLAHGFQVHQSGRHSECSSSVVAEPCGKNTPQISVHWEAEMGQEARPGCDVQALPAVTYSARLVPTT